MRFAFHCIDQQTLSLCSHWSFWLQDNALTPKRRSYMEAVSNSQLNMNPMEVRAHPHRPWEYNHNANKNPKATHKSSNSHSRRRSPWVKWPPAVPIWLQWAIARSTFWRSVNSQVNISDWVTSNLLWFVWPNSYFKREFVLKFILQFPGRAASPCQVSRPSVAAIFKTNPALIFPILFFFLLGFVIGIILPLSYSMNTPWDPFRRPSLDKNPSAWW